MFCYCAESRRLARLLTARYDKQLAEADLSVAQFEVLNVIGAMEQVNGRALAEQLAVDPTTSSRNLKTLVTDKHVRARKSTTDGRQLDYSLTAKGLKRLEVARPLWEQAHAATMADLGTQADPTLQTLQAMTERLRT